MSKVTVTSPNPNYTGVTAGIAFADGKGEFDPDRQHAAARYFDRHGYTYPAGESVGDEQADESSEPTEPGEPTAPEGEQADEQPDEQPDELAAENGEQTEQADEPTKPSKGKTASK